MFDPDSGLISAALRGGDRVQITGFGSFKASSRGERTGRNPRTGEAMTIAASKSVKFVPGASFKSALNQ